MNTKFVLKVAVVAIIAITAVILIVTYSDDENEYPLGFYTYTDEEGTEHTIYSYYDSNNYRHSTEIPISNVSVQHKYIPVFMKIIGKEDEVSGIDNTYAIQFKEYFTDTFDLGSLFYPDGETMLAHGSTILLSATTMGVMNNESLNEMGIDVIYLDFANPTQIEASLEILVNLFGATDDVVERANLYMSLYNECFEYVEQFDFSDTADADFCLYMSSSGFYQTHTSSAVNVIESISGKSYTRTVDPNVTDSVYMSASPTVIYDFDGKYGLDYLFLYGCDTADEDLKVFLNSGKDIDFTDMSCFKNHKVFALAANCVNGALSPVSAILYAKAFGADVGNKAEEMVQKFNEAFGLTNSLEDLLVEVA